ncbi:MAG TPA: helix-turn-helix domain-containing protein, partial [Polyangia bacterium]|nr:helix-turn-helix domain-containing protein [Polyangia bacterium]
DVPLLVEHFVREALDGDEAATREALTSITDDNWRRLASHPWPGNVRELRNFIERTLALTGGVDANDADTSGAARTLPVGDAAAGRDAALDLSRPFIEARQELLAAFEKGYLEAQLSRHGGNISRAARAAGLDRMHFKRLLARHQPPDPS